MPVQMNPYLNFRSEAREALGFYASVFGGEPTVSTFGEMGIGDGEEADKVMHGQLATAAGFVLMCADTPSSMDREPGTSYAVSLSGGPQEDEELRRFWERLTEGAQVQEPLVTAPWGDAFGMLTDRFGVRWMVNIGAGETSEG